MDASDKTETFTMNCACSNSFISAYPNKQTGYSIRCPHCHQILFVKPPWITQKEFKQAKSDYLNVVPISESEENKTEIPPAQSTKDNSVAVQSPDYVEEAEFLIIESVCNRCLGRSVQNGHGALTNKRFIYSRHSLGKLLALGLWVNLTSASYEFEIPLSQIEDIFEGRHALSKTILIKTKDGQVYNFWFSKRKDWLNEFQIALKTNCGSLL